VGQNYAEPLKRLTMAFNKLAEFSYLRIAQKRRQPHIGDARLIVDDLDIVGRKLRAKSARSRPDRTWR
jgi:hypothetical protein